MTTEALEQIVEPAFGWGQHSAYQTLDVYTSGLAQMYCGGIPAPDMPDIQIAPLDPIRPPIFIERFPKPREHEVKIIDPVTESNTTVYSFFEEEDLRIRTLHTPWGTDHKDKELIDTTYLPYKDM